MTSYQTEPPVLMPISLDQARAALRFDDDDTSKDDEVTDFIEGVTQEVENTIGQAIMPQVWRVQVDQLDNIKLPHPAREVLALRYRDKGGATVVVDASSYEIDRQRYESFLVAAPGVTWPETDGSASAVTVDVRVFMAETVEKVPPAIRLYIKQRIKQQFDPAARLERDTDQSRYTESLLDQFKVKP